MARSEITETPRRAATSDYRAALLQLPHHNGGRPQATPPVIPPRAPRTGLALRAALGARPQTAAAAVTLAEALRPGQEADQLREAAGITARELGPTWLLRAS